MIIGLSFRALAMSLALLGAGASCGSGGGIEGKYVNTATGAFAFELKGGKVLNVEGQPGILPMTYTVRNDSVFIAPPGMPADQALGFAIKGDGVLESAVGSLKKQ